jgi:hypothetical protein
MSEIKVNKISPKQTCTQLTLGDSGDTIIIPAGATITNNGTATGFGRTGTVDWDTTKKTTGFTAVNGSGYFCDTTSAAFTVNLPAGVAGDIVAVSDYANTAATNNITIAPNGTDKINGTNQSTKITTNGASATLLYIDSTRGWKDINDATLDLTGIPPFVAATGGTVLTCGDYKTHVFTGPGSFVVSSAGGAGSSTVEYIVIAGGGGGGSTSGHGDTAAGAGAGGFRQNYPSPVSAGLPVTATTYPITVGGGGAGVPGANDGASGSNSIFSTITSAGGGGGAGMTPTRNGVAGGSGGGGGGGSAPQAQAGAGNTPPVSPSQGNPGGRGSQYPGPALSDSASAGGGGAGAAGQSTPVGNNSSGAGGVGTPLSPAIFGPTAPSYGTPGPAPGRYFSGGGGGAGYSVTPYAPGAGGAGGGGAGAASPANGTPGTTNTGGGGGGGNGAPGIGGTGGSGIVLIRYKFQ